MRNRGLSVIINSSTTQAVDHSNAPASRWSLSAAMGSLLFGNAAVLSSYWFGWISLGELLWTYWLHSVVIGLFNFRRMMRLKQFSTTGLTSNGRPVPETPAGKRSGAVFFLCHYGFFHLGYAVFLGVQHTKDLILWPWLALTAVSFIVGEWFSYREHRAADDQTRPNLGSMMFLPYLRIIPMHLTILAGGLGGAGLVFFPLKVLSDGIMLLVDHQMDRKREGILIADPRE
jgi:hypothetical protein